MARKACKPQNGTHSSASRTRTHQKPQPQRGRVVKKRQTTTKKISTRLAPEQIKRMKREASQHIKIKITKDSFLDDAKQKKKKKKKCKAVRSVDYKRVGLDHPTSSPAIAKMSENDRIKGAMNDLTSGRFRFVSKAAAYWQVHAAKLYRRHSGEVPLVARRGPKSALTEQDEEALVDWVVTMGKKGFPVAPSMVCDAVKVFFKKEGNPFINDRPSHTWYHKFVRRHPKLQEGLKMSRMTAICRAEDTKIMIDEWFRELNQYLTDLGVADKPAQIWCFGQTGFEMNKRTQRMVLTFFRPRERAATSPIDLDDYDQRREVDICVCANAAGNLLPPFIICKGLKHAPKDSSFLEDAPRGSGMLLLEGYSGAEDSFGYWIKNHLVPNLGEERPVVLLVELNESEISYGAYTAASRHGIHLFRVPPQASALLLPLNIGDEGAFKSSWLMKWVKSNRHVPVNFKNVGGVISEAWLYAENPEAIRTCFIQSGVYPLDREMVDDEHLPRGDYRILDAVNQPDDEVAVDGSDGDDGTDEDADHTDSLTQELFEERIPESKQPIAALLLFQKLDDTLEKSTQETYRTCVESGLDLQEDPLFAIWKKLYTEAFRNDPNVPLTSVEEVVVITTEKQESKDFVFVRGLGQEDSQHTVCPVCKEQYGDDEEEWIGCDGDCQMWYHVHCLPPELVTPAMLEDKEMFCPQCSKSRKAQEELVQQ
ncbi:uncharacterized protein LOC119745937 [Patiria miniata]|uniref:PHD-type domain-containing protein n=1 Tax=Patiria miniata TaxID=46514 RepID=A0A914BSI1_PATMI|nr:uncharacterized protein LOC119745937 [Patiria miniata]XP_038078569.1 uncharacterized protein LOC119745937 [Patiria miniata]XP_038078571.1 uncharacterized protein LOC119745937 [Patiria miniata]